MAATMTPAEREEAAAVALGLQLIGGRSWQLYIDYLDDKRIFGNTRVEYWRLWHDVSQSLNGGSIDDQSRIIKIGSVLS